MSKTKSFISKSIYEHNGIIYYEKIYAGETKKPFWGLTYNVLKKLENEELPYCIKLVWVGNGGIIIDEKELNNILKNKAISRDGDYKIQYSDLNKFNWVKNMVNKIKK